MTLEEVLNSIKKKKSMILKLLTLRVYL